MKRMGCESVLENQLICFVQTPYVRHSTTHSLFSKECAKLWKNWMNAMRNRNVNEKVTKNVRVLKFILFKCLWVLCYFGLCICVQCKIRNGVLDLLIFIYLRLQISVAAGESSFWILNIYHKVINAPVM